MLHLYILNYQQKGFHINRQIIHSLTSKVSGKVSIFSASAKLPELQTCTSAQIKIQQCFVLAQVLLTQRSWATSTPVPKCSLFRREKTLGTRWIEPISGAKTRLANHQKGRVNTTVALKRQFINSSHQYLFIFSFNYLFSFSRQRSFVSTH